jgi:hypothetical protein
MNSERLWGVHVKALTTTAYNVEMVETLCFEVDVLAERATKGQ